MIKTLEERYQDAISKFNKKVLNKAPKIKLEASKGNKKLGKDTLILNFGPALTCPSKKLGLCKIGSKCYALKAEKMYPACLPFRVRQAKQWSTLTAETIAELIIAKNERARIKIKYLRFSEAGDFYGQSDIDKIETIAKTLYLNAGIITYGYTARRDLDYSKVKYAIINGSDFMVHNQFTAVKEYGNSKTGTYHCAGNCRICDLCKAQKNAYIQVLMH